MPNQPIGCNLRSSPTLQYTCFGPFFIHVVPWDLSLCLLLQQSPHRCIGRCELFGPIVASRGVNIAFICDAQPGSRLAAAQLAPLPRPGRVGRGRLRAVCASPAAGLRRRSCGERAVASRVSRSPVAPARRRCERPYERPYVPAERRLRRALCDLCECFSTRFSTPFNSIHQISTSTLR